MATIFHNPHAALFFNQMTMGIKDKLGINDSNAANWFAGYDGDPERHILHIIDAVVGFISDPNQKVDLESISRFVPYLIQMLDDSGCSIDLAHLMELYRQIQDECEGEINAWRVLQLKAQKEGIDSIGEADIDELWRTIPDNLGYLYDLG